jgi:hypothetical protein
MSAFWEICFFGGGIISTLEMDGQEGHTHLTCAILYVCMYLMYVLRGMYRAVGDLTGRTGAERMGSAIKNAKMIDSEDLRPTNRCAANLE